MKILFYSFFILFLIGCSSKKYYTSKGDLKNITDARLIKNVEDNYVEFNTLFCKKFAAEINIDGDKKSFKGNLFINEDKEIIVSILPLMGIELARVKFNEDSIIVINRSNKTLTQENYGFLWDKFSLDIDYKLLYRILLNQLHTYPLSQNFEEEIKRYKHYNESDKYVFKSVKKNRYNRLTKRNNKNDLVLHDLYILPEVFKISKSLIKDYSSNSDLVIKYEDFSQLNGHLIPNKLIIEGRRGNNQISLSVKYDSIEIDGKNRIGFKVSNKYNIVKK